MPSVYWGCHYGACTPGFSPVLASSPAFAATTTSVAMRYPASGAYDAAYDIWFDPTARRDGQNTGEEVMVWLGHAGPPQPVGTKVATVTLAGATWDVWFGNIGWNVISYVRQTTASSASFPVSTFYDDVVARGYGQRSWYLTSVQAGFEPWQGGAGLAVTGFSAGTGTTSSPSPRPAPSSSPSPAPTPRPSSTTTPPPSGGTCSVGYAVDNAWPGGLVSTGTVRNDGVARSSWTAVVTLPAGQRVVNAWNGTAIQAGQTVTVRSAPYNGSLAAGASTTFGLRVSASGSTGPAAATSCG